MYTVQPLGGDVVNSSIFSRCTQLEQENRELCEQVLALKQTIDILNCSVQRLNLSLLSDCQVQMYTGLPRKTVECLLTWLQPVSRKKGATDELAPSQKLLLVLMRLRCNFPQNDLVCHFNIEQSSVSRILNQWIPMLKVQLKALILDGHKPLLVQLTLHTIYYPMLLPLLIELKFLFKDQVIWQHKNLHTVTTKVIPP